LGPAYCAFFLVVKVGGEGGKGTHSRGKGGGKLRVFVSENALVFPCLPPRGGEGKGAKRYRCDCCTAKGGGEKKKPRYFLSMTHYVFDVARDRKGEHKEAHFGELGRRRGGEERGTGAPDFLLRRRKKRKRGGGGGEEKPRTSGDSLFPMIEEEKRS